MYARERPSTTMPTHVGPYVLGRQIGQGTFGRVLSAVHKVTNIEYAIKVLQKCDIVANELTVNVRREVAIMRALRHTNIVSLHQVLSSRTKIYIVMELVTGEELFQKLQGPWKPDESLARLYFQQLIDGLSYCHARGVYHRDLKPENLLITPGDTLKIADFGVSALANTSGTHKLLYTACGTPHYCAPEILRASENGYDGAKCDVWSTGIILYSLLAGHLPFDVHNDNLPVLYERIVKEKVEFPKGFPEHAKPLVEKLLCKEPADRPTLEEVKKHPWFRVGYAQMKRKKRRLERENEHVEKKSNSSSGTTTASSFSSSSCSTSADSARKEDMKWKVRSVHTLRKNLLENEDVETLVRDLLPNKQGVQRKARKAAQEMAVIGFECVEDLHFVAQNTGAPQLFAEWIECRTNVPAITCLRIALFFYEK